MEAHITLIQRVQSIIMVAFHPDQVVTVVGMTIGITLHLYMAIVAVSQLPYMFTDHSTSSILPPPVVLHIPSSMPASISGITVYQYDDQGMQLFDSEALRHAVDFWLQDEHQAAVEYGPISDWNVSEVTDMSYLFAQTDFCDDLSQWDTSSVLNMTAMFQEATSFQSDLSSWKVSQVQDFAHMFHEATSFDGDVSTWDVTGASDFSFMFCDAVNFRGDLSTWLTDCNKYGYNYEDKSLSFGSTTTQQSLPTEISMESMFENAVLFDSELALWETGAVVNTRSMFRNAVSFDSYLRDWNISSIQTMNGMFHGTQSFSGMLCWDIAETVDTTDMRNGSKGNLDVYCATGAWSTDADDLQDTLDGTDEHDSSVWGLLFR